mgnify:CR=1 FL=1
MLDRDLRPARFHECESPWLQSLSLEHVKCLIVCRGPVRKEAMDVFDQMGIREYGMLLSEKDSIVYPKCLAPELRGCGELTLPGQGLGERIPDHTLVELSGRHRTIRVVRNEGHTGLAGSRNVGLGLATHDVNQISVSERLQGPSASHFFGTDDKGRDIYSAIVMGARISVSVSSTIRS